MITVSSRILVVITNINHVFDGIMARKGAALSNVTSLKSRLNCSYARTRLKCVRRVMVEPSPQITILMTIEGWFLLLP